MHRLQVIPLPSTQTPAAADTGRATPLWSLLCLVDLGGALTSVQGEQHLLAGAMLLGAIGAGACVIRASRGSRHGETSR